jgi:hypothetical protein
MGAVWALLLLMMALPHSTFAQSRNRAPGFEALPKGSTLVIMPADIELFELTAGGMLEPKADWTEAASKHLQAALEKKREEIGVKTLVLSERDADEMSEINALHGAVARAISFHHFGLGSLKLPTKGDKLDWSMGDPIRVVKQKTGADYAFFTWIRDSYASGERVAMMIALALLGIGVGGGAQVGYASLVDLNTGQILWFNQLVRAHGDLREADKAAETLNALLTEFPATK